MPGKPIYAFVVKRLAAIATGVLTLSMFMAATPLALAQETPEATTILKNLEIDSDAKAAFDAALLAEDNNDHAGAVRAWQTLLKAGRPVAMWQTSRLLATAPEPLRNRNVAGDLIRRAAMQGYAPARLTLGRNLMEGRFGTTDVYKAAQFMQLAADTGFAPAQVWLGRAYLIGKGVRQDPRSALQWFERAAAGNHPMGLFMMGFAYEAGTGVPPNAARASDFYRRSAAVATALTSDARVPEWLKNEARSWRSDAQAAIDELSDRLATEAARSAQVQAAARPKPSAPAPSATATASAAPKPSSTAAPAAAPTRNLEGGASSPAATASPPATAVTKPAAAAPAAVAAAAPPASPPTTRPALTAPPPAATSTAPVSVPVPPASQHAPPLTREEQLAAAKAADARRDYATALRLWTALDQAGLPEAAYRLGVLHYTGAAGRTDRETAARLFARAAAANHPEAQRMYGIVLDAGEGVTRNPGAAMDWWRKAADGGDAIAMNNLGVAYMEGRNVDKDLRIARRHFETAQKAGNQQAASNLKLLARHEQTEQQEARGRSSSEFSLSKLFSGIGSAIGSVAQGLGAAVDQVASGLAQVDLAGVVRVGTAFAGGLTAYAAMQQGDFDVASSGITQLVTALSTSDSEMIAAANAQASATVEAAAQARREEAEKRRRQEEALAQQAQQQASARPQIPSNVPPGLDPRCAQGRSCQIFGCEVGNANTPSYCRQRGFADAIDICASMGGTWRNGPGGAPFIWCDFPQVAQAPTSTGEMPIIETPRQSSADRFRGLADIAGMVLEIAGGGPATPDVALNRAQTMADMQGNLADARQVCNSADSRQELSECFDNLAMAFVRQAALCEDNAQDMSTLGPFADRGFPDRHAGPGQEESFYACRDLHARGARAAECVATNILRSDTQFNPLLKSCMEREGLK